MRTLNELRMLAEEAIKINDNKFFTAQEMMSVFAEIDRLTAGYSDTFFNGKSVKDYCTSAGKQRKYETQGQCIKCGKEIR